MFESKNHKLDKLTIKNLSLLSHRHFGFRLLKLCEMLFQKANAVDVESWDSSLLRKKRSHRQEYLSWNLFALNVKNCLVISETTLARKKPKRSSDQLCPAGVHLWIIL